MSHHDDRKKFYCREWAFQKLSHCLDQRPVSKTCGALLLGGSGCGKTTFCSEICWPSQGPAGRQQRALNRRLLCYHFLQGHNEKSLSLSEFVRSLVTQILNHSTESHRERSIRRKLNESTTTTTGAVGTTSVVVTPSTSLERKDLINLPTNPRTLIADAYLEKLKSDPEIQIALRAKNIELNPDDCLKRALLFPLLEIDPPKTSLFILIDSIDEYSFIYSNSTLTRSKPKEIRSNQSKTIAELLANHHHLFPQWLLLVCTAKKQSKSIAKMFTGFRKLSLDDLRKSQVVRDVQQYILARLDQENSLRQHISRDTAEMLNQLHIKSNGCFLYLEKVLDGVSDNFIVLREIREIPGTLNGLYLWLCQRLFNRKQFIKVQPLLNVILAAKCLLNETLLYDIIKVYYPNITIDDLKKRFNLLKRILIIQSKSNDGTDGTIRLFHHSFAEWLLDIKHCTQKYLCNIYNGHCILAMYYTLHAKYLNNQEIYDYTFHLTRMEQYLNENNNKTNNKLLYNKINKQQQQQQDDNNDDDNNIILKTINDKTTTTIPIYAEINKIKKIDNDENNQLDIHTLTVLWLILSGCNVEDCLLEGNEMAGVNFGAFLPTDQKVLKLLLEAGAIEQEINNDNDNNGECSGIYDDDDNHHQLLSIISSENDEQSPEPLFDLHGQAAALHIASRLGQAQIVKILLESGANPDEADLDGWTPLRAAAWGGHTDVVELLVKHGCELDSVDSENRTALRAASWSGHEEIVKILLKNGANVNKTDNEGRTALIAASYMGHSEIVEHLLNYGANINHSDADGRTALSVAALCSPSRLYSINVVTILLDNGAYVDHKDNEGMTPLLVASFEGNKDIVELLLENEADCDHCDNNGRSPLWAAASMGHANVVELLLFWGCCIDTMDIDGRTVLSVSAAQGCVEVVKQLLNRGLDEQHRDNSGWTPLHYAAFEGHIDVCETLLEAGCKIDEIDNEGKSPLHLATQSGHKNLVDILLEKYKAPIEQRPHDGKTAIRLAALEGHNDIIKILLKYGSNINSKDADGRSTLYVLALDNRIDMLKYFIELGADVETRDLEGRTPLHVSSWQGHKDIVELLLIYGKCNVDAIDNENRTALHSASWQGHNDIVKLLLKYGAKPDHTCNQGATPLGIAAQEGHELCCLTLLENGANPNLSDTCGRNAIRVAIKSGHKNIVKLLEEYQQQQQQKTSSSQYNINNNKTHNNSSSANSITSGSTTETKPSSALLLYPNNDWIDHQRRSMISLGNHSSNSKSSSNLTGSSHSSRHGGSGEKRNDKNEIIQQPLSFTQQLQQCSRGGKTRPLSKLLSPLQSEPQSPIYASPPLSPIHDSTITTPNLFGHMNIYQPVLRHNNFAKAPDTHFARDTHMRIILGNSSSTTSAFLSKFDKKNEQIQEKSSNQKPKRNGIVTNPALRLVANVKNGLDSAAANLRKSTSGGGNPTTKTNSFHWKKETPL